MKFKSDQDDPSDAGISTPFGVQLLSFLCGLLVAYLGFKSCRQDVLLIDKLTHLDRFTETPGKLLHVKVRQDSLGSDKEFYPDVLYEYFVDGESVWGWRFSFEEEPRARAYWEGRLSAYKPEASVPVFFNPENPKESILEKKQQGLFRALVKLGVGALFCAAGWTLAILPVIAWLKKGFSSKK